MSKKVFITVDDEVFCRISGLEPADHKVLEEKFAVMVEGAYFMPLYRLGRWDGKVHFFDKAGKIYFRLLDEVTPYLDKWGYDLEIVDNRKAQPIVQTRIHANWFKDKPEHKLGVVLRPYQVDAVNAALEATSGFILAATGSGKCIDGNTPINIRVGGIIGEYFENLERSRT